MNVLCQRQFVQMFAENCHCPSETLASCPLSALRFGSEGDVGTEQLRTLSEEELEKLDRRLVLCLARASCLVR